MCTICAAFAPYLDDCTYRALGLVPPDADTTASPPPRVTSNASISETADAASDTSTAYAIEVADTFIGDLSPAGDRDFVAIELTAGSTYVFTVAGNGSAALSDSIIRIRDADGTIIALNDDASAGFHASLGFTASTTGTYYIDVGSYNDSGSGGYRLTTMLDSGSAPFGTHDELADFLTDGFWISRGGARHSFDTSVSNVITVDISRLTVEGQKLAMWSFQAFEQIIDVKFDLVIVPGTFDPDAPGFNAYNFADMTFYDDDSGAFASYVANGSGDTQRSWINVSTAWLANNGTGINDYAFQTYLHEIGHALGLGHQGAYNGNATFGVDNTFANDSWLMSMMSYFNQDESLYTGAGFANTISPMVIDVIALQALYGAADTGTSPTAGDTIYGVGHTFANAFAGTEINDYGSYLAAAFDYLTTGLDPNSYFDATPMSFTITDVGGRDKIDFSTDTNDQIVSLKDETLSTVFNAYGSGRNDNMWIARGSVIEEFVAGSGDDFVIGNTAANTLTGNGGQDTLDGQAGDDTLLGGAGNDSIAGGADNDSIEGGMGADSLRGDDGQDTLRGGSGADTLIGGAQDDVLYGDDSTDILIGGAGADTMDGGAESDVFYVTTGDIVTDTGPSGYDRAQVTELTGQNLDMAGWGGVERVNGHLGDDTIDASTQSASLVLFGSDGADRLTGGAGDDTLLGGAGADALIGCDGQNVMLGGTGDDTFTGGANNDLFYISDNGDSIVDGGGGYDRALVNAGSGLSLAVGGWLSVERIVGFTGNDTIDATGATDAKVLLGAGGSDNLTGGTRADILLGGDGNDALSGGAGDDTMQGGMGNDTFDGGGGNDQFFIGETGDFVADGGSGFDTAIVNNASGISINIGAWVSVERIEGFTGNDTIDATGSTENLTIASGNGPDQVTGGAGNDTVYAGSDADLVLGGAGDDALIGGGGDDTLSGEAGNDFLLGGVGSDHFIFDDAFGIDVVADFQSGDILDFSAHSAVDELADLSISGDGTHTYISLVIGNADLLTLANFNGTLGGDDFNFAIV